ncbi:MAG: hypothetical protein AAF658_10030, partial [Myxococcota bacterium]
MTRKRMHVVAMASLTLCVAPGSIAAQTAQGETTTRTKEGPERETRPKDPTLEGYRLPFEKLLARSIGTTSRAVRFDWRDSPFGLAAQAGQLSELNTFRSGRYGLLLRVPLGGTVIGEFGAAYARTTSTASSRSLALTPFRQAGRPSRFEFEGRVRDRDILDIPALAGQK